MCNTYKLLPNAEDLLSAGVAAGIAYMEKRNLQNEAVYQLVTGLIGDNIAQNSQVLQPLSKQLAPLGANESDVATGAVRAGNAMWRRQSAKEAGKCFLRGAGSRIIARALKQKLNM